MMPPQALADSFHTPKQVRHSFDSVIQSLNDRWGLKLPNVHGSQEAALQHADGVLDLAGRCSGRIRFLCFKECDLEKVICEFEEEVPRICSEWVWKPSQEGGTLPKLPVTKSFISSTSILPQKSRQPLLQRLFDLLDEEYKLAQDSNAYSRTSFTEKQAQRTVTPNLVADVSRHKPSEVEVKAGVTSKRQPQKSREGVKRKSSESHKVWSDIIRSDSTSSILADKRSFSKKSAKFSKKQMTLSQMDGFRRPNETEDAAVTIKQMSDGSPNHQVEPVVQSFDSVNESNAAPHVFTPSRARANVSIASEQTSFPNECETSSPDLFPTQDVQEIVADVGFKTSFSRLSEPTKSNALFHELCERTPFKPSELGVSHDITFGHRCEVERVAGELHITPRELLHSFRKRGISSKDDYASFWEASRVIGKSQGRDLPAKSNPEAWKSASGSFFLAGKPHKSVYLSGTLTFKSKPGDGIFDFRLNPFQLDKTCRFHRKYGPSRFMVVSLPPLSADTKGHFNPYKHKLGGPEGLTKSVAQWLATDHYFLGRKWKAFFLEPDNKKKAKSTKFASDHKATAHGHKINLFAVSGEDIPSHDVTEVEQFFNWHINIQENMNSMDLKLFQRLSLGLSKTFPSVTIDVADFIRLPDPVGHAVMNDGCASMSMTLAKAITREMGLGTPPSTFQGRIAGSKGLWAAVSDEHSTSLGRSGRWIEIADSQLKIQPHPKDDFLADEEKRTFEVVKHSGSRKSAALNIQLLTVLHEQGVPRDVLGKLLIDDMKATFQQLEDSMGDSASIRAWLESSSIYTREEGSIKLIGSWPDHSAEQAIQLIESGFTPEDNPELWGVVADLLSKYLESYVERVRIQVPCSAYLFCVADPYGVLEPDEVHLSFSDVWSDPASDFKESFVEGQDVLVGRLPARFPSDIQRRKAVWKKELHHLKDVIVFPTKGDAPLAGMLSGGDYDGDEAWICWDQNVVRPFRDVDLPDMPAKEQFLVSFNRKVNEIFTEGAGSDQLASQMEDFLAGCFAFNLRGSYHGRCAMEHDKVVYHGHGLSDPKAIVLATVCGYLVDSPKQGYSLTPENLRKLFSDVSPMHLEKPAYQTDGGSARPKDSNIIDHLKLRVAAEERQNILAKFNSRWPKPRGKDLALCRPWRSVAENSKKGSGIAALPQKVVQKLEQDVDEIVKAWELRIPKAREWKSGEYALLISNLHEQFQAIMPSEDVPALANLWQVEEGKDHGRWPWLRASCLYNRVWTKLPWLLCGKELCNIKVQAHPDGYRVVDNRLYPILKCNKKMVERNRQKRDRVSFEETLNYENMDREYLTDEED